jgi:hypothetical protein
MLSLSVARAPDHPNRYAAATFCHFQQMNTLNNGHLKEKQQ